VNFETNGSGTGILGASGSGKSMTLRCVAGIEKPDSGRIVLGGRVLFDSEKGINLPARHRGIGMVFQHYALFPHMTAADNIAFGLDSLTRTNGTGVWMNCFLSFVSNRWAGGIPRNFQADSSSVSRSRERCRRIPTPYSSTSRSPRSMIISAVS
jgi:ABC-type sugar transport system ATPase subunit